MLCPQPHVGSGKPIAGRASSRAQDCQNEDEDSGLAMAPPTAKGSPGVSSAASMAMPPAVKPDTVLDGGDELVELALWQG